ncbi:MAG: DciA family protein [Pseudomonadota bacterium]
MAGTYLPRLTRKAFEKHGFGTPALITDWAAIAGARLARLTMPEKLRWPKVAKSVEDLTADDAGRPGATLTLRVEPAAALDVQYAAAEIIGRINAYFGYRAVTELRIVQGSLAAAAPNVVPAPRTPPKPAAAGLAADAGIGNDRLRAALMQLEANVSAARS